MSKQTAVDYLFETLCGENGYVDTYYVEVIKKIEAIYEEAKAMEREQIEAALPSKDDAVNVGFRKAINADYNLRKVCKDSDDDLYYSGWMDCYDWLNATYKGGEQ